MRFLMAVLVCGQFIGCSNGHENTSTLDAEYQGNEFMKVTYHEQRIFVISDEAKLQTPEFHHRGTVTTLNRTTRAQGEGIAWFTKPSNLKGGETFHIAAQLSGKKSVLAFRLAEDLSTLIMLDNREAPLPRLRLVQGNQVDAAAFVKAFNAYRARYGLRPVRYSYRLSVDAARNNSLQNRYGIGHHFMGSASGQNSAMGYGSISGAMNGWHNSSGHRVNMQRRGWTCMGIHRSGRYWTQNFSSWQNCQ